MSKIYFCPNFDEICNVGVSQEELVALVWRHQEFLPLEEPMSSLPRETLRLHQKQGRPSWRRTQQHVLMFWSLTSAPSSLSGLLWTSSTQWNFLWTSWCNPLQLLLCLPFLDMKTYCAAVKLIFSDVYHLQVYLAFPLVYITLNYDLQFPNLFCRNNAGVMFCPFQLSKDGVEMQFATNHLGIFLLPTCLY